MIITIYPVHSSRINQNQKTEKLNLNRIVSILPISPTDSDKLAEPEPNYDRNEDKIYPYLYSFYEDRDKPPIRAWTFNRF